MRVLVADDSALYREMLRKLLTTWGYEVVLAADGEQAQQVLDRRELPPLAILDWEMPGPSGLELCQRIRSRRDHYIYTILLSSNDQQADVMKAFEIGVDDYLRKPLEELELRARLKVGERIVTVQRDLAAARKALEFEATHDSLVSVWNRRAIFDLLAKELSRGRRLKTPTSVFLADLDFFKRVNDDYGHLVGDDVLRAAAQKMARTVRLYDSVGRYGGEEFLVVLPNCSGEVAMQVAERVRQQIADGPVLDKPVQVHISMSLGVAQWSGGEIPDLIRAADNALYRAKQNGRNRVEMANNGGTGAAVTDTLQPSPPLG